MVSVIPYDVARMQGVVHRHAGEPRIPIDVATTRAAGRPGRRPRRRSVGPTAACASCVSQAGQPRGSCLIPYVGETPMGTHCAAVSPSGGRPEDHRMPGPYHSARSSDLPLARSCHTKGIQRRRGTTRGSSSRVAPRLAAAGPVQSDHASNAYRRSPRLLSPRRSRGTVSCGPPAATAPSSNPRMGSHGG